MLWVHGRIQFTFVTKRNALFVRVFDQTKFNELCERQRSKDGHSLQYQFSGNLGKDIKNGVPIITFG